jgi:hypothetical protein
LIDRCVHRCELLRRLRKLALRMAVQLFRLGQRAALIGEAGAYSGADPAALVVRQRVAPAERGCGVLARGTYLGKERVSTCHA